MRPLLISMTAVSVVLALPAFAAENAQDFVDKAAVGGKSEVAGKLALDKAQNQAVKDFAQKMIRDHGDASAKLESIAGEQKLKVPTTLDASHDLDNSARASRRSMQLTWICSARLMTMPSSCWRTMPATVTMPPSRHSTSRRSVP